MTEDQTVLSLIRDYWVQIGVFISFVVGYANLKWQVKENKAYIDVLKQVHKDIDNNMMSRLDKIDGKVDQVYKDQSKDIKDILIMLSEIKRN